DLAAEQEHVPVAERFVLILRLGEGGKLLLRMIELAEAEVGERHPRPAFDTVAELREHRQSDRGMLPCFGEVTVLEMQLGQGLAAARGQPRRLVGSKICESEVEKSNGLGDLTGVLPDPGEVGDRDETSGTIIGLGELAQLSAGARSLVRVGDSDDDASESGHRLDEWVVGLRTEVGEHLCRRGKLMPPRKHSPGRGLYGEDPAGVLGQVRRHRPPARKSSRIWKCSMTRMCSPLTIQKGRRAESMTTTLSSSRSRRRLSVGVRLSSSARSLPTACSCPGPRMSSMSPSHVSTAHCSTVLSMRSPSPDSPRRRWPYSRMVSSIRKRASP